MSFGTKAAAEVREAIGPLIRSDPGLAGKVLEATVGFLGPRMRNWRRPYSVETLTGVLHRLAEHPDILRAVPDLRAFVHRSLREAEKPRIRPNPLRALRDSDIAPYSTVDPTDRRR